MTRVYVTPYGTWRVGTFVTNSERAARKRAAEVDELTWVYVGRERWELAK